MINAAVGLAVNLEIGQVIQTRNRVCGHAIYGPYEYLQAGHYTVTFLIRRVGVPNASNALCALVDVATDQGRSAVAYDFIFASSLTSDFTEIVLPFELDQAAVVEYRVYTDGSELLEIAETRNVVKLTDDCSTTIKASSDLPRLLVDGRSEVKKLYESGVAFNLINEQLHAMLDGVSFHAEQRDDINFIDELFFKKAYNFVADVETCVIDVGMNIALASLQFAAKAGVREVHAFEPFPETFLRARANLKLNPELAQRIEVHNYGLGERDADTTFLVKDTQGDSGGQATLNVEGGIPIKLSIRDAGETLRPILTSAGQRGLTRVVKIDCEGAEFDIFKSLTRADLWGEIDTLMVEWHRVFAGSSQDELVRPLLAAGFIVIDLTPPSGNGFFYAHRLPAASRNPNKLRRLRQAKGALFGLAHG